MKDGKRTEKADFTEKQEIKQMIDVLWYRNAPEYRVIAKKIKRAWRKYAGRDEQGSDELTRYSEAQYQAIAQRLKAVEIHPKEPLTGGHEPQAPDQLEQQEQIALVQWAKKYQAAFPELLNLFAIPNGGKRAKRVAKMMVAEGVKAGVPDLFLAVPKDPHHGLFIEMKRTDGGRISNKQREWISRLKKQGYKVVVCNGFPAAREAIKEYLEVAIDGHRG